MNQEEYLKQKQLAAERGEVNALLDIAYELHLIRDVIEAEARPRIVDFKLQQLNSEGAFMAITGTAVGTTSTFNITFVPATNFVPLTSGPTVSVDDTNVTLGAVDASNNFTAAVAAGDTAASYNLTISGVNDKGVAVSHVFNVPILPTPPPPATSITDFGLNQVS
jgi:hypothetical protein